ncbi:4Fe-4S dicluster domain-containing protein [Mobilicoccus caccae]|uniref:4Fe-4S ferredoxin-type domain-containing protein n=1 Tax=Mobilicoccus caccae TaxID=1859295 RepID=A0ABQ6IPB0_9MICO|nr:4Fe-4S dicluster domain-containing protein [Mobilicoccus caccae]GMA39088.1 hypothetical protein GCM10025883_11330 [Mobilicoccus caccae]
MDRPDPVSAAVDLRSVIDHLSTGGPWHVSLVDADSAPVTAASDLTTAAVLVPNLSEHLVPGVLVELLAVPAVAGLHVVSDDPMLMVAVRQAAALARAVGHGVSPALVPTHRASERAEVVLDPRRMAVPRRTLFGAHRVGAAPRSETDRLVRAVAALTGGTIPPALDRLPTGVPRWETRGCNENGACARICPVQALDLIAPTATADDESDDGAPRQWGLTIHDTVCIGCGLCATACPEQALASDRSLTWSELLSGRDTRVLDAGLRHPCRRCGTPQPTADGLCRICAQTFADPFAVHLPNRRGH